MKMMGEATSDSEGDDEKTSKTGGKPKSSTGSSKRSRYADEIPEDYSFLKCMGYISTYNIYIYIYIYSFISDIL